MYIIKSSKARWYYVGSTNDVDRRLGEHNQGKVSSSKNYRPLQLSWQKEFGNEKDARSYERLIKDKRILKEALTKSIENK